MAMKLKFWRAKFLDCIERLNANFKFLSVVTVSLLISLLISITIVDALQIGIEVRAKLEKAVGKPVETYRALIIGINNYKDNRIPDLKIAVNDARDLVKIFLDERETGKTTPDDIHTEVGEHELKLEKKTKKGRIIHKGKIKVKPDSRVALLITDFKQETTSVGMVFIKGGCFDMGDTFGDGDSDEKPVHEVCVDDFFIGEHEVTQRKWKGIMGNNPSNFKNCGDDCPVEKVSWNDVQGFIRKLNRKTGMNYRLPTEAEWEFAAREGGKKEKWAGTSSESEFKSYAWYNSNSDGKTHLVKTKRPNSLGLYDMTGNVWEWVSGWYDSEYYKKSPRNNPKGPDSGENRVLRGGSWDEEPENVRTAFRERDTPATRGDDNGFRIAHDPVK